MDLFLSITSSSYRTHSLHFKKEPIRDQCLLYNEHEAPFFDYLCYTSGNCRGGPTPYVIQGGMVMKRWTNESLQLIGLISSLLIGTIFYTILLVESDSGLLGLLILPVIVVSSLAFGMRAGLTISVTLLVFLFIYFQSFAPLNAQGEVQFFNWRGIGFTTLILMLSVVSGLVHQLVRRVQQSRLALEERARQLIAVDPETWLDNEIGRAHV